MEKEIVGSTKFCYQIAWAGFSNNSDDVIRMERKLKKIYRRHHRRNLFTTQYQKMKLEQFL